jgi:hypothetical protein
VKRAFLIPIILTITFFSLAAQNNRFLDITNETGFTIAAVYISDADADNWNIDYLEGRTLQNGETLQIPLERLDADQVNVRGRDDEGDTYTVYGINTGSEDVRLTLNDIDPD